MTPNRITTKIAKGGRVVIPAEYRHALKLNVGDEVIFTLEQGEIRIIPLQEALSRARDIVGQYVQSPSLADELIAQRREEANL
jgi:AbrB family looped-hinge helix DNA binding protein